MKDTHYNDQKKKYKKTNNDFTEHYTYKLKIEQHEPH
jgi:hypothetical protein